MEDNDEQWKYDEQHQSNGIHSGEKGQNNELYIILEVKRVKTMTLVLLLLLLSVNKVKNNVPYLLKEKKVKIMPFI